MGIGIPTLAYGDPSSRRDAAPPLTANIVAYDFGFEDAPGSRHNTVTIAPGGTVDFGYPTGTNFHNVDFDVDPTSCTQTAGANFGPVPPLPAAPQRPGWAGNCRFDTPGTYAFRCDAHAFMTGTVVVDAGTPTATATATETATATATETQTATA